MAWWAPSPRWRCCCSSGPCCPRASTCCAGATETERSDMAVIAMTKEMATLGKDVALGVAEALGLQMVRHEVGDVVAGKMQVKKSLIRRIREGKANKIEKWSADEKTISIFTAEEVYDLAQNGNVLIRGWGATLLL